MITQALQIGRDVSAVAALLVAFGVGVVLVSVAGGALALTLWPDQVAALYGI